METAKDFKHMKKTEEVTEGCIYAPYIPVTDGTYINGVKVWDHRWWMNILCKINWFFHFRMRKRHKKYANTKIDSSFYTVLPETFKSTTSCDEVMGCIERLKEFYSEYCANCGSHCPGVYNSKARSACEIYHQK